MFEKFIKPILVIIAVSMFAWILFWSRINISKKKYGKKLTYRAELILFVFYIYVISVMALTIIPLPFTRFQLSTGDVNLIPVLNTVKDLRVTLAHHREISEHTWQNLIGNIIMFIPLGIFLPILSYRYRTLINVIIIAFICSASIETIQFIERVFDVYRYVDIDDVILNTTGAILGFVIIHSLLLKKDKMQWRGLNDW